MACDHRNFYITLGRSYCMDCRSELVDRGTRRPETGSAKVIDLQKARETRRGD